MPIMPGTDPRVALYFERAGLGDLAGVLIELGAAISRPGES